MSCTFGTTHPSSVPDSSIWREAWANLDSSRSTGGIVHNPGMKTSRQRIMRPTPPRRHERAVARAARASSVPVTLSTQERTARMALPYRRMISDYNRGVHPVVRVGHVVWGMFREFIRFLADPVRVHWALPVALAVLGLLVFLPWDGPISQAARSLR